jgi:pilus assembly protein Flp/PilA
VLFFSDQHGATAIEYGLIAALIAVGCITSFIVFGNGLELLFGTGVEGPAAIMGDAAQGIGG